MMRKGTMNIIRLPLALACVLALSACATDTNLAHNPRASSAAVTDMPDRMEGYNRFMFKVNDAIDRNALEPIARGYRYIAPVPVRQGVSNVLRNLKSPNNIANQLLQGDFKGAGNDVVRFVVNTTIGVGGIFDVAGANGYKYQQEDFGQTLGAWGVGHGSYFVIPVLGPSSLRDGTGMVVDAVTDPFYLYFHNVDEDWVNYTRLGVTLLAAREDLLDAVADLRAHSFDYYASTRSAYAQRRAALLRDSNAAKPAPGAPGASGEKAAPGDHP
jgi:phospholipid-binding lipoprotein MlaA